MEPEELRTIGVVVGAHGLQGTLKVSPLSDFPERFAVLNQVYLVRDGVVQTGYSVKRVRWSNQHVLITLRELTTRTAAELVCGSEICIPEQESWKLPEDVFYISELIGYRAVDEQGNSIGVLREVGSGAQDLLVFTTDTGDLIVPFVKAWVGKVDEEARTIEIFNWKALSDSDMVQLPPEPDDH